MSQFVFFNGVRLVQPGGASKIDASAFDVAPAEGVGTMAVVGEATDGEPGKLIAFSSASAMARYFGSGPLADAARIAFRPLNDTRIGERSATTVYAYKVNPSTPGTLTLKNSAEEVLRLSTLRHGAAAAQIKCTVADVSGGRSFTIADGNGASEQIVVPATAKFSVTYKGTQANPKLTVVDSAVSDGVIDSILLDSDAALDAEKLEIVFSASGITTIQQLVDAINTSSKNSFWGAAVIDTRSASRFNPAHLDATSAQTLTASVAAPVYGLLEDCITAINSQSSLVTAALPSGFDTRKVPDASAAASFAPGAAGVTTQSLITAAFTALEKVDVPHVALALSEDGASFTVAASLAKLEEHCARMSSTAGKKERTGYGAISGNKSTVRAQAELRNSPHLVLFAQKWLGLDADGNSKTYGEWAWAVAAASARAGMDPGEPLTWKYFSALGASQDASWSPEIDADDLLLSGVCVVGQDRRGVKVLKGITTYTKMDNDVFTEESIITNVKAMVKAFREHLELRYTGRKATPQAAALIKGSAVDFWSQMRSEGRIVDSTAGGQITKLAYRNIEVRLVRDQLFVDVEISPVSGINFQLETIRLVPAVMSA